MSALSLTSKVGISPRSRVLVEEEFRILGMSPSDTDSKQDRALLFLLCLVREKDTDDCSATLIFIILSLKKCTKVLAKSVGLMRSGKIMAEDLCKIFVPQSLGVTIIFSNDCRIVLVS